MLMSDVNFDAEDLKWCKPCQQHKDGHCDRCGTPFMAREVHYRSVSFHLHPGTPSGVNGHRSVQQELCVDCYRIDFIESYPGGTPPDLPDRGMDPNFHAAQITERKRLRAMKILEAARSRIPIEEVDQADQELLARLVEVGLRFA